MIQAFPLWYRCTGTGGRYTSSTQVAHLPCIQGIEVLPSKVLYTGVKTTFVHNITLSYVITVYTVFMFTCVPPFQEGTRVQRVFLGGRGGRGRRRGSRTTFQFQWLTRKVILWQELNEFLVDHRWQFFP